MKSGPSVPSIKSAQTEILLVAIVVIIVATTANDSKNKEPIPLGNTYLIMPTFGN